MPFLVINGVTAPVAVASYREDSEEVGSTARAFSGAQRRSRLARKRNASFELTWQVAATARAWESLLSGEGHRWSLDADVYSSKGKAYSSGGTVSIDATRAKFGAKSLKMAAAASVEFHDGGNGGNQNASCMFWFWNGAAWDHYIFLSSGTVYKNWAVGSAPAALDVTVSPGSCQVDNISGGDVWIDDVVTMPFAVPAAWATTEQFGNGAYPNTPRLEVEGDAIAEGGTRAMLGRVESMELGVGNRSAARVTNLHKLVVKLEEA